MSAAVVSSANWFEVNLSMIGTPKKWLSL
jgi:hypothetical protein